MMTNDYLAPIAAKLTLNGALNLRATIETPHPKVPTAINGGNRLHTGLGKWTTIAAMGVANNLIALGLAEDRADNWFVATPLGMEVARYIHANWEDLEFREGARR